MLNGYSQWLNIREKNNNFLETFLWLAFSHKKDAIKY